MLTTHSSTNSVPTFKSCQFSTLNVADTTHTICFGLAWWLVWIHARNPSMWMLSAVKYPRARHFSPSQSLICQQQKTVLATCENIYDQGAGSDHFLIMSLSWFQCCWSELHHCGKQLVDSLTIAYIRHTPVEWMRNMEISSQRCTRHFTTKSVANSTINCHFMEQLIMFGGLHLSRKDWKKWLVNTGGTCF